MDATHLFCESAIQICETNLRSMSAEYELHDKAKVDVFGVSVCSSECRGGDIGESAGDTACSAGRRRASKSASARYFIMSRNRFDFNAIVLARHDARHTKGADRSFASECRKRPRGDTRGRRERGQDPQLRESLAQGGQGPRAYHGAAPSGPGSPIGVHSRS